MQESVRAGFEIEIYRKDRVGKEKWTWDSHERWDGSLCRSGLPESRLRNGPRSTTTLSTGNLVSVRLKRPCRREGALTD